LNEYNFEDIQSFKKRDKRYDQKGPAIHLIPFPVIKYKHTPDNRMYIFMDTVDTIMAPAMVVPCNIFSSNYIEMDGAVRKQLGFYTVPFEFLCRDDWADIEQQGERATAQGINTQIYEQASESERNLLLNNVLKQYPILEEEEKEEEEEEEEEGEEETE